MSWSPIIQEERVDTPDSDQSGVERQNRTSTSTAPTRSKLDSGKAAGLRAPKFRRQIDTTQTDHLSSGVPYDITDS